MPIILIILAANLALAVWWAIRRRMNKESMGLAWFFAFLPGLGFAAYYIPKLLARTESGVGVERDVIDMPAYEIEPRPEHPNVREELNVVPVEDAMAVSNNTDRRNLLQGQLNGNLEEKYRFVLAAERDTDAESASYMSAAKSEIYNIHQTRWLESRRDFEENPDNPETFHAAMNALEDLLNSHVLTEGEAQAYRRRLCGLMQRQMRVDEDVVKQEEYEEYLKALVELGRVEEAESLWQNSADRIRSEESYRDMLKIYYQAGARQKFEDMLNDLRRNRQVRLSAQGLEQLRYWTSRLADESAAS